MKRWTTVVGRGGTVLIAISLALLLVSLIPQINLITLGGSASVSPGMVQATNSHLLNPQQGVKIKATVEGTINLYLLEVSSGQIFPGTGGGMVLTNATDLQEFLDAFLDANPDLIIWNYTLEDETFERSYIPTKVANATLVFHNPSLDERAIVDYELSLISTVAPGEKVRNITYWAAPIGVILAIPWLVNIWKERKQS
jgi:hypothetical protein